MENLKFLLISCDMHARDEGVVDWEYQKCISQAASDNGWDCLVLAPRDAGFLLPGWMAVLPRVSRQDRALRKFYVNSLPLGRSIYQACLPQARRRSGELALLAKSLSGYGQILGVALAAIFLRRFRPHLMIMVRKPVSQRMTVGIFYFLADVLLRIFRVRTSYFTDTEALARCVGRFLRRPLTVLPIPHVRFEPFSPLKIPEDGPVLCWWPGRPREEKGLKTIGRLARLIDGKSPRIRLIAAASSGIQARDGGWEVEHVPDGLDRKSYLSLMERVHLVLLPYDNPEYSQRSSGIFVEAVAAGKPVAVPKRTWMAQELEHHGLHRFIMDWESPRISDLIRLAVGECRHQDPFAPLREEYLLRHNPRNFAAVLKSAEMEPVMNQPGFYDSAATPPSAIEEFRDIWRYRDLLVLMVVNSIKTRYKRSLLGVAWTLLNPLIHTVVIALAFSAAFQSALPRYSLYVLLGLICWNFMTQTATHAMGNLVWGSGLLKRIHIPPTVFVLTPVGNGLINLGLSLIPLTALMLVLGHPFHAAWLFLPFAVLILALFASGLALIFSTLAVFFTDIVNVYQALVQAVFFLTPVMYPKEIIPLRYRWIQDINPLYHLVELFRSPLYSGDLPAPGTIVRAASLSLAVFAFGWWIFTRKAKEFAYRI
ncbi:MAG: hypothetical protein A3J74_11680 [Elusimicrobia bacterium RIFCSPHIGHO2_02_FULL_57_9]|nr:MAG: hypothetical protein A3J74_11680 [Elusimicrobia bacterium RIFCSPHIGHO2_02_FULL_57_9]